MPNDKPVQQPTNTPTFRLAHEIPQHRQAKLAGRKYLGPTRNIVPKWSQVRTTTAPILSTNKIPAIKGLPVLDDQKPQPQKTEPNLEIGNAQDLLNEQNNQLLSKLRQKEDELKKLREQSGQQRENLKVLKNKQKTSDAMMRNMKQQLSNLQKHNITEEELLALQEKIDSKAEESKSLKGEIESIQSGFTDEEKLEKQVQNYRRQTSLLLEQQQKLQAMVQQSESQLEALTKKLTEEKHAKGNKDSQIKKLEKMLDETVRTSLSPPETTTRIVQVNKKSAKDLPVLTKIPNAITGVVTDKNGKIIMDTVVLIKNVAGQNLRALKTNPLGQFITTTSLPNGKYFIESSSSGHSFDTIEITLTGAVVPPIHIKSHEIAT